MAVINVNLEDTYQCKTTDQLISVDVAIGDGLVGSAIVFLGTDLKNLPVLGSKADVTGKIATIVVAIVGSLGSQALTTLYWTSVILTLGEDTVGNTTFPTYKKLIQNDDTIVYTLQIYFS